MTALDVSFAGRRPRLFWLALRTSVLTVLTLGLYRFWMKTRLRRWYWSGVRVGGHPLEYVGEPLEKLLGFLIAVVFLAFYIGIVNLILMFASFALFQGNVFAYAISFVGVIPVLFYARYRALRYRLARTRWRGIRFGLMPGAWGYAGRALLWWGLTILTLGILWPVMTFRLEKYRAERTVWGDLTLEQGGGPGMLYRAAPPLIAGLAAIAGGAGLGLASPEGFENWITALGFGAGSLVALYGLVHYRVASLRILTNSKRAGPLRLEARFSPGRVAAILVFGHLVSGLVLAVLLTALAAAAGAVLAAAAPDFALDIASERLPELGGLPAAALAVVAALTYFLLFILWGALRHAFVTMPLWRHYAETLTVTGTEELHRVRQKGRDAHMEAEGFAEALDIGAAI